MAPGRRVSLAPVPLTVAEILSITCLVGESVGWAALARAVRSASTASSGWTITIPLAHSWDSSLSSWVGTSRAAWETESAAACRTASWSASSSPSQAPLLATRTCSLGNIPKEPR